MVDQEIRMNFQDYSTLVEEFKDNHTIYEKNLRNATTPDDLKKVMKFDLS